MVRFAAALLRQVSLFTREWIEIPTVLLQIYPCCCVSLFTREWIEILTLPFRSTTQDVSLFTREWIEIRNKNKRFLVSASPSLRGSGLK